jgi:hypothetical protein
MTHDRWARRAAGALLFASIPGLLGCAAFREGKLPPIEKWPPPAVATPRAINVNVVGNVVGKLQTSWERESMRAFRESGLFSEVVATSRSDAPLRASVKVEYRGRLSRGWMALSGFTLFLIPVPAGENSFALETTIYEGDVEKGRVAREETCTIWMQLLLILAAPFLREETAFYDAMRSTILEARERGFV